MILHVCMVSPPPPAAYRGWMAKPLVLEVDGREVTVTSPDKLLFPAGDGRTGLTKLDLVQYYLAVAEGALRGVRGRPMILKRFVKGITEEAFFQKRAPATRPDWVEVAELKYASGRSAEEVVVRDAELGVFDPSATPAEREPWPSPRPVR